MSRFTFPSAAIVLASLTAACSAGETNFSAVPTVGDSAGVRIVEHSERTWSKAAASWRLEAEPVLAIGVVEGPPEYEFFSVKGALRLDDGTIVVADGGSKEIRFFDGQGAHIRSVGGDGAGPREYDVIQLLSRHGADSLLVWDSFLRRGTILGNDGTFGRTVRGPDLDGRFPNIIGAFGDGFLLGTYTPRDRPKGEPLGAKRRTEIFFRSSLSGAVDTIGEFFLNEEYVIPRGYMYRMPFARNGVAAAAGEYLHYGSSDTYEIRTYTVGGDLVRIIRSPRSFPVTQQDVDAIMAETTEPQRRRIYSEMKWPETLPAYKEFSVDARGNLWVGDYLRPGEHERRWTIFGPDGDLLGTLVTPPRFTLFDAGSNYVLGSVRDELDVERVMLYRLIKLDRP